MIKDSDVDSLITMAASFYGVEEEELRTPRGKWEVSAVRQTCMYILHEKWGVTLKTTAQIFGYQKNSSHGLALRACRIVNDLILVNKDFREQFDRFMLEVNEFLPIDEKKEKKVIELKEIVKEDIEFQQKVYVIEQKIAEWKKLKAEIKERILDLESHL